MLKNNMLAIITFLFFSCSTTTKEQEVILSKEDVNPAATDFDHVNSDKKAIAIADKVMESMGGRTAWDNTKIINWNFFGARTLLWNKESGDLRIELGRADSNVILTNLFNHQGKVKLNGEEQVEQDSITKYTAMAESMWNNDAYWLLMPFKLKDSKTTLKYLAVDTTTIGVASHVLELTFAEVGDTPENKYWVYVDTTTMLVNQWAFFSNNQDTLPRFKTPWDDYQKYGNILLSGNRGARGITEIEVLDSINSKVFSDF